MFPVQTTAHSNKVQCLDIGETGRVLVTGGHDRLVNLFAIGNDKPIQVSDTKIQLCERSDDENEVKSLMSVGSVVCFANQFTNNHLIHLITSFSANFF